MPNHHSTIIMAPNKSSKRNSNQSASNSTVMVPMKEPTTPESSPLIRAKAGITLEQKKTLIENLQLEITERARRLRAQYHLQAQGLRSRIEIRINRIPTALRKMKMEDLVRKYQHKEQAVLRPPVPAKDTLPRVYSPKQNSRAAITRGKRVSTEISGGDKENEIEGDTRKKRVRTVMRPTQVLSPTSSNSRLVNQRDNNNNNGTSPIKSHLSRPGSPLKGTRSAVSAASMLSNMVEKAKAARSASTRKVTSVASARLGSANANAAAGAKKTRKAAPAKQSSRPVTRAGRRVSTQSETSEGSNGTVVRKTAASKASTTAATAKKTGMRGGIRKGAAGSRATAPTTSSSGRVLRKRT